MMRGIINIIWFMETKRLSEKSRKIEYIEYTLWYTERDKIRNGV